MGLFAGSPPMLMNQCWLNRARVSSSASWKHSGDRDAVKLTARLQNTLTYYHNDAAFSNEAGSFRDGSRKNPTHNEIAALRSIICLSPTAQSKDFNA